MALAKGAVILEKHITVDRADQWEDYQSALGKSDFQEFMGLVQNLAPLLKSVDSLNSYEMQYRKTFKKSPVARQDLVEKQSLDASAFEFVKHAQYSVPVSGINISGRQIKSPMKKGEVIRMSNVHNKVGGIIVARCTSNRLPDKAMRLIQGRESISLLIERVKRCRNLDCVVLATSTDSSDDALEEIAKREDILPFRGSLDDLSLRFYEAAKHYGLNQIVRITGDDILRDEVMIDKAVEDHLYRSCDVTFTKNMPYGTSSEVFGLNTLETILNTATIASHTEYLEWYLQNDRYFSVNYVESSYDFDPEIRLTLDYEEDLKLFSNIFDHFYPTKPDFTLTDTLAYLKEHPEVSNINKMMKAKYTSKDIDVSLKILESYERHVIIKKIMAG